MILTISDASTQSRFTTFTISDADELFVRRTSNVLGDTKPKQFRVEAAGIIAELHDTLHAVETIRESLVLFEAISNERQAVTIKTGELVQISADSGSCADKAETGVITDVNFQDDGGVHRQFCTFSFLPVDYLYVRAATSDAVWLPSIPS